MLGIIKKFFKQQYYLYLVSSATRKFRWVKWGSNIKFYGKPIFSFSKEASIEIEDDVVFINKTEYNYVGIFKPCSIAVRGKAKLKIGKGSGFSGVSIYCRKEIIIGENLTCGGNVFIWDTDFHPIKSDDRIKDDRSAIKNKPIKIGNNVFIGANSIILKGSIIENGAVIGAGSVVSGTIPGNEIWLGNSARFFRKID
ncbi:MAG: acyltransferase [Ignavibacteria bacterium]|nr:acyltransferase [Ignavibacteria bacterium]